MIASLFVTIVAACFVAVLVLIAFFAWLNMRNAKKEDSFYDHSFNPEKDLAANVIHHKEAEVDPAVALKAHAHPVKHTVKES